MLLSELIEKSCGARDPDITMMTADSRAVQPGALFAALPGNKSDGRDFIEAAIQKGAVAILATAGTDIPDQIVHVVAENPRLRWAQLAARFYAERPRHLVAVTGTNGKTSTVFFTQQLWESLGLKAASLGTLGLRGTDLMRDGAMTTPDPVTLHAQLSDLAAQGYDHVAMEASSHGLAQFRLDGLRVQVAGFTNLSRDHLDYHATMDEYLAAKARLFSDIVTADGVAVINADIPEFEKLRMLCKGRMISYGVAGDIRLVTRQPLPQGQALDLMIGGRSYKLTLPLVGAFQAMNALCALGMVIAEAPDNHDRTAHLVEALAHLRGAPGRLQLVPGHPAGAAVYVDYAHTPDALDNVLQSLRPHTEGRLVCVFGCGGDRDPGKRPLMGQIVADKADMAIVTDDNPRTENPASIRAAVMAAMAGRVVEIGDRRAAIQHAVENLSAGDVLVIAGKGHERGQIIGTIIEPFDDAEEAAAAIENLQNGRVVGNG